MSIRPFERWTRDLRQKPILLGAMLVFATMLLYGPVEHHEFLNFDDGAYVTKNIHVSTGVSLANVAWAFTSFYEANWHPVTWISHMVDCQLFGLRSGPHHLINVALHAANVLLLFLLLQKATGAVWRSLLVAALFAVHPLNVETVAWVAERKSLLCTLFSLLTIATYGWYIQRPSWNRYLVIMATFSLALMSKPMAVSLPLVLLLLDYWPLQRYRNLPIRAKWLRLSTEKLPLVLMSTASSALTIAAQRSGGAVVGISALPLTARLGNATVSYVAYIGKMFWPTKLAVFYPLPDHTLPWTDVIASAVTLLAITVAVLYVHRARYLTMGWLLFVTTLIPVIGIVQVGHQAMADRYAYIPCIGLFLIIVWGLNDVFSLTAINPVIRMCTALCLILVLSVATRRDLQNWQTGLSLITRARVVADKPDWMLEELFADALLSSGRVNEAFQHYSEACSLDANLADCHYNMAEILFSGRQLQNALEQYQLAGRSTGSSDMALSCLINSGQILMDLGDYKTAEQEFAVALQIDPNNSTALLLRRQAYDQVGSGTR
ncbi:MAG: tetratricopeptide repeat protein [Terriglobales bacterium]